MMNNDKNTMRRIAVIALALGLVLTAAVAVQAREAPALRNDDFTVPAGGSSAEGAGVAQFPGCPPANPDVVTLSGSGSGDQWSFQYTTENIGCDGWTNSATASGTWDPAVGGCLFFGLNQLCLTNPVGVPGVAATYSYSNSFDANSGTVALVFS